MHISFVFLNKYLIVFKKNKDFKNIRYKNKLYETFESLEDIDSGMEGIL